MRFFTPLRALAVSILALAIAATVGVVAATTTVDPIATTAMPATTDATADLLSQEAPRGEDEISRGGVRNGVDDPEDVWQASLEARTLALASAAEAIDETDEAIAARLAEEKAAKERAEAALMRGGTPAQNRELGRRLAADLYGWGGDQFTCYDNIIMRESLWVTTADNPTSSAYGIPQALPGKKMASEGADWLTNPATQIKWGLKYIKDRYGTPCSAWSFKKARGWY